MRRHQSLILRQIAILFGIALIGLSILSLYRIYRVQQEVRMKGYFDTDRVLDSYGPVPNMLPLVSLAAGTVLLAIPMFQYLQGNRLLDHNSSDERIMFRIIEANNELLRKLQESVIELKALPVVNDNHLKIDLSAAEKSKLLDNLAKSVSQSFTADFVRTFEAQYSEQIRKNQQWSSLFGGLSGIRERLLREIGDLSRRANVNLVIGVTTTIFAVSGLLFAVFGNNIDLVNTPKDERIAKVLFFYLPRLSLIVFIEVFAYFFLRLYKAGLTDIKFYQNELTNVETKVAALESSFISADKEILTDVIGELSKTERNFILKKDETTVEIEKFKLEEINFKEILQQLPSVIKLRS